MTKELERLLGEIDIEWDSKVNYIPYLAHIINLIIQTFLGTLLTDEDNGIIFKTLNDKIYKIGKSIRSNDIKWEMFKRLCIFYGCIPMTIPLDIFIRWYSIFRML